jgi:demethylmenaquinone methyltransferase / 2-methoxy-6-polyprenyl-1,4-benzoquinol methylase
MALISSPDLLPVKEPHLPLTAYYQTEQERQAYLKNIFDNTAPDYDRIERMMAFNTGSRYRRQALVRVGLQANMKVLDVGVGTGLVAAQACLLTGDPTCVTGVDPSTGMMAASNVRKGMVFIEGRAEALPFPDNHFDFLSMGYALRHISDLSKAFAEFERVRKPGGRLCILEMTKPQSGFATWLLKTYMRGVIPLLTRIVSKQKDSKTIWRYFWDSIEACVPPERVMVTLRSAGLTQVNRHLEIGVFSEYQAIKRSHEASGSVPV